MSRAIPIEAVQSRLSELESERDDVVSKAEKRIAEIDVEETVLRGILGYAVDVSVDQPRKHSKRPESTTQMIMKLVDRNEGKYTASEVSDLLKDHIETDSSDPRRVVYNSVINLLNRGALAKDGDDGTLYAIEEPEDDEAINGHEAPARIFN